LLLTGSASGDVPGKSFIEVSVYESSSEDEGTSDTFTRSKKGEFRSSRINIKSTMGT